MTETQKKLGALTVQVTAATNAVSALWAKHNAEANKAHDAGNTKLAMIHARRANRFKAAVTYGVNFVESVKRIEESEAKDALLLDKAIEADAK